MSVSVVISKGGEVEGGIPIATEEAFKTLWRPGIDELGLEWVDLFQTGVFVAQEDWPEINRELLLLRRWAVGKLDTDDAEYVTRRIDRLLTELPRVLMDQEYEIWIG